MDERSATEVKRVMDIFLVGGAVRDKLLSLEPKDKDYVVLNSSSEELKALGFQQVGNSFSIFLHPKTKEEYALPRGGNLEEDLLKRDLTINSMALSENGELIDPFGGRADLENKILRHVSPYFNEDPLRVFRVFRFKTLHPEFSIAPETLSLISELVKSEAFKRIIPERIFQELKIVMESEKPSIFFEGLRSVDGLNIYFKELEDLIGVPQTLKYHPEGDAWIHTMLVLDEAARISQDVLVRYSALVHDFGKGTTPKKILPRHIGHEESGVKLVKAFGQRLMIPSEWTKAAVVVTRFHLRVHMLKEMKANTIVRMFYEMDAFRKPFLVKVLSDACRADEMGKLKDPLTSSSKLETYFEVIKSIGASHVSQDHRGEAVGEAIRAERVRKLKDFMDHTDK